MIHIQDILKHGCIELGTPKYKHFHNKNKNPY